MILDVVSIVFVCVTMNHLGLVGKIEEIIGREIPILNCPKCSTFWATVGYFCCETAEHTTITVLAISFMASYMAIWLELIEGFIDTLYNKVYEKIYADTDNDEAASDSNESDTAGTLSDL